MRIQRRATNLRKIGDAYTSGFHHLLDTYLRLRGTYDLTGEKDQEFVLYRPEGTVVHAE